MAVADCGRMEGNGKALRVSHSSMYPRYVLLIACVMNQRLHFSSLFIHSGSCGPEAGLFLVFFCDILPPHLVLEMSLHKRFSPFLPLTVTR